MVPTRIWPGAAYPLGATPTAEGVNFALFSESATEVELCIFDNADEPAESIRIRMREHTDLVWHCLVPGLEAGQLYGYRVHGPYDPAQGKRFNSSKLLLDPYAKALTGLIDWGEEMFPYQVNGGDKADLFKDERDNGWGMPKCVVIDPRFDWGDDRRLNTPMAESVIYEVHVKGFSKRCPHIAPDLRGTYAALGSEWALDYFRSLGVTAIELLPVHHFVNDQFLQDKGLSNYWGYNSIGYFAPHSAYASSGSRGQQVQEFKQMVKSLHSAGIEVILDVVYNHTGEGNHLGPMLSFRGIDNAAYYRLVANEPRYYMDYTGCGNSLNMLHPRVLQLIMDSLRYWVLEMHVDGFRFDLAATLARELHEVSRLASFFDIIHQDPVLSQVKLIAEPWDLGEGGYQVGNFPVLWAEWNGKYRDCVRSYWKGDHGTTAEMGFRLTGSSDLYSEDGRKPYASVNFLTAHDGFTLNDLVSYNDKHNEANGEDNRDGESHNRSWNCGAEGPTDDEEICKLRRRQLRNFLSTLLLSQGVPMLLAGDEFARTQQGNNNAYCQDNEISWFDWNQEGWRTALREFTSRLIQFRHDHPVFRRPKFFVGRRIRGSDIKDIMWFAANGIHMSDDDWEAGIRCFGLFLSGQTQDVVDHHGEPVKDDSFLIVLNSHHEPIPFTMPGREGLRWELVLNTAEEQGFLPSPKSMNAGTVYEMLERSLSLFRLAEKAKGRGGLWTKEQRLPKKKPVKAKPRVIRTGKEERITEPTPLDVIEKLPGTTDKPE